MCSAILAVPITLIVVTSVKNKNNKKINELDILIRTILIYLLARNFRNKYAFA
ncbi:hypothetical protein CSC15_0148 [Escherichia coli]|nr:hypothetical protein AB34_0954 [Escherichia coli 2-460-02_S1_C2]PRW50622.1 hypothetical protein CSC07_4988 [Escherichia coli]PVF83470.1 hypothetical protein CSC15_0148 [Escherichia coli]